MDNIKYIEAIHELQLQLTKISAFIESEIGSSSNSGNLANRISNIEQDIKDIKNGSTGPDGYYLKINKIENEISSISLDIKRLTNWKEAIERIASIPQFEEMKKEIESQKTKWIIAGTIFTIAQVSIGLILKYFI